MRLLIALLISGIAILPARAETLTFEGRVEAAERAELSSRLDGVVAEILFSAGDPVEAGQPMIRLDPADAEIALAIADARVDLARAERDGAEREAERQEQLFARGISPDAVVGPARTALAAAEAALALAEAERRKAVLDLERTVIRAPISGFALPPATSLGAFQEAEAGSPLGEIISLDPVVVSYRVPYATRLEIIARSGASSLDALFDRIALSLVLPGDIAYPHEERPAATSAAVDPEDGTLTLRAVFPNPDALLRPGMALTVRSRLLPLETQ